MTVADCDEGVRNGEDDVGRLSRKEKRKLLKKMKRKEKRKDVALKEKEEEETKLNDPEELMRMEALEKDEKERVERERKEFEERERLWMEKTKKKKEEEEEEARRQMEEELQKEQVQDENNYTDGFEYVEEGPAEIIWQGNEIIVKKKKVKVPKKSDEPTNQGDAERPTSNPLPPQCESFMDSLDAPVFSAQQAYDNLAQQVPSFGTEQDKAHCPFHIKTGVCRFGSRCNRAHFYPDKSCTLLIKNMYSGPGLAWEQDEALEYTEEEVERSFEEFYEDVHTEFLKFGELINFKVCRNGSAHLRGNVYVHYKCLDSAILAYCSLNGRYFAGKQVKCEYVGVTRWKVAICGEYMKTRLRTCSRGTACNFIHCFRNPGGDYEWADWDKPPPKFWVLKMSALFGYTDDSIDKFRTQSPSQLRDKCSQTMITPDANRYYHPRRSRSRDRDSLSGSSHGDHYKKIDHLVDTKRNEYEGRGNSKYKPERDCMGTGMLRNNSGELSNSRIITDRQTRYEEFIFCEDEVYEDDADQDRSSKALHNEPHCSRARNRSRHEVEVTKDSKAKRRSLCSLEGDPNDDGRTRHGSAVKDRLHCTNWDKGRDEEERITHKYHEENRCDRRRRDKNIISLKRTSHDRDEEDEDERITHKYHEEDRYDRRRRDKNIISLMRTSHDRAVINHSYGKENGHSHQKKRRIGSAYSPDYADKKKTYSTESHDIHSGDGGQCQLNSSINLENNVVGLCDDRWDPSEK